MIERTSCAGCVRDLGGGQCGMNVERECADGGHEAWTPRTAFADVVEVGDYWDMYMAGAGIDVAQTYGGYVVEWEVPNEDSIQKWVYTDRPDYADFYPPHNYIGEEAVGGENTCQP